MEDEIEAKQKYLREEIIDQGYDPEVFSKYIIDLKGEDGFDLENWTMDELASLVRNFKSQLNEEREPKVIEPIYTEPLKAKKTFQYEIEPYQESQHYQEENYPQQQQSHTNYNDNVIEEQIEQSTQSQGGNYEQSGFVEDEPKVNLPQAKYEDEKEEDTQQTVPQQSEVVTQQEEIQPITQQNAPKDTIQNVIEEGSPKHLIETTAPIVMEKNPVIESTEVVVCNKADKTILTDMSKLTVVISNPELLKNGIFSFAFLQFTLTTEVIDKVITRKLSDFEWFYYKLHEMFPGVCIPFFPLKKMFEKKNDAKFHMKKQFYLQKFINALIKTKIIRTSQLFFDFISQPKEQWKSTRAALEKTPGPANMSKFTTMEGIINISITKDLDRKALCIQRDINTKVILYNKVNAALKSVISQISVMSNCFLELSTAYKELSKGYNDSLFKNDFLSKGYRKLDRLINDWSVGYTKQTEFFSTELRYYFKFMKKEISGFTFLVDEYKTSRSKYFDYFNKMAKVPFLNNQQHAELSSLKKYYGFFMNRSINEYYRLQKNHMKRLKLHFDTLTDRRSEFIVDYMTFIQLVSFNLN